MEINVNQFGVTSLGSGSKGNATIVAFGDTKLLVDSGYSCKVLEARLKERDVDPKEISAVLVTHEHGDHFNGVPTFANKYGLPVWMNAGTSLHKKASNINQLNIFNSHQEFEFDSITVHPVAVPHDSREACQFIFKAGDFQLGILTDLGHITPFIKQQFIGCDILLLEFNYDHQLLQSGPYPPALKSRVAGEFGHLSNAQASDFLTEEITNSLKYLVAMHMSEKNNQPELILSSIESKAFLQSVNFSIAHQNDGFEWIYL